MTPPAVFDVLDDGTCTIIPLLHAMCVNGVVVAPITPHHVCYGHLTQTSTIDRTEEEAIIEGREGRVKYRYFIGVYHLPSKASGPANISTLASQPWRPW